MSLPPILQPEPESLLALIEEIAGSAAVLMPQKAAEVDASLRRPQAMPMWIFQAVRDKLMHMRSLEARDQDNAPGFAQRLALLHDLIAKAPWMFDPNMGVWPKPADVPAVQK